VGGIVFQEDKVLLVKRGKEPGFGKWSIPGGAVDVGEYVKAALRREIEEETGLLVEVLDLVEIFERIIPDDRGKILYHYVLLDYWCGVISGQLKAQSDAADAGFFPIDSLDTMDLPRETAEVIQKAYEKYQKILLDKK
jgi:ADP-ribose pyrophosphatase YjhB (NUDIX family)